MNDPLIDDVKALLDKEKGDERILKQIYRACENNEVISNYERNYVRTLAEKYLGRIPQVEEKQSREEKPIVPDVLLSKTLMKQNMDTKPVSHTRNIKSTSKNTKVLLGVGGAIFAILIVVSISTTGVLNMNSGDSQIISEEPPASLSIKTDLSTYQKGDIISISGASNISGQVNLSIMNQDGKLIWSEKISVKSNGSFSTLAIAGGDGWDKSGTFTIKVNNNSETQSKTFSFKA